MFSSAKIRIICGEQAVFPSVFFLVNKYRAKRVAGVVKLSKKMKRLHRNPNLSARLNENVWTCVLKRIEVSIKTFKGINFLL